MQRLKPWWQHRPAAWHHALILCLLALTILFTLDSSASKPNRVARAEGSSPSETQSRALAEIAEPIRQAAPADEPGDADTHEDAVSNGTAQSDPFAGVSSALTPVAPADSPTAAEPTNQSPAGAPACGLDQSVVNAASFGPDDRLVMTYFYYWYDGASLADPALAQRPPADPPLDWRSVEWHERQLADMASVGVDVALVVYWGDTAPWSVQALKPMVEARERLLAAGIRAPALGLFFDTNMYAMILPERPELSDLTTADGQAMLAHQVGVFLDEVPPCHRARVDGRVLAFFWRADTEDGDRFTFDDRTFAGLNDLIIQKYGERLHFALEETWVAAAHKANVEIGAADLYTWGAALKGPRFLGRTIAVGPGYDDRLLDGRPGYLRERTDGDTYSRDLRSAVISGTSWLLLETWNELWEGTAIAETEESGRTYLDITARYTSLFHQLNAEHARDGWFDLGFSQGVYLRRLADAPVEKGTSANAGGRSGARPFREDDDGTGYFHFAIDRRLGLAEAQPLTVLVEYFDGNDGSFALEYDSLDAAADGGVYKLTEDVPFLGTGTWRAYRFELPDASLRSRQYDGGGDFRIHDRPGSDNQLHIFGRVMVTAEPAARPVPLAPESLAFIKPSPDQTIPLRWAEAEAAPGYRVAVQPFHADDTDLTQRGASTADRRHCVGEANLDAGQATRGFGHLTTCELQIRSDLEEGVYRWRVVALDASGSPRGEPSDWAYFIVARN